MNILNLKFIFIIIGLKINIRGENILNKVPIAKYSLILVNTENNKG